MTHSNSHILFRLIYGAGLGDKVLGHLYPQGKILKVGGGFPAAITALLTLPL